jgi:hypothetical protein
MNYNINTSLSPYPRNKYLRRSRFLNINKRIGTYNQERPKTIEEIQEDEIQNLNINDKKIIQFFEIFTNPNIISAKSNIPTPERLLQSQLQGNQQILLDIIGLMKQIFINDIKNIRKLKISSKMIDDISKLKEGILSIISNQQQQPQPQPQQQSIFKKIGEIVKGLFKKEITTGQISQQEIQSEQGQSELINSMFTKIIQAFQKLITKITDVNLAAFLNSHFEITIGQIFDQIPEFQRESSLQKLRNIKCNFNLLSLAVFLGIESLVVLFILLGANPSLVNQLNQDASYHLMFFQMTFRNIAMRIGWNPSEKKEDKVYGSYNPEVESKIQTIQTYEKIINNIQRIQNPTEKDINLISDVSRRLTELKNSIQKEQAQQPPYSNTPKGRSLTIEDLQREIKHILAILQQQQTQQQTQQQEILKQQIQQQEILKQQIQQQEILKQQIQQQPLQKQFKVGYNFEIYLFSNSKISRILTFLSFFGNGIDLSRLVPQNDTIKKYFYGNARRYIDVKVELSTLIAMSKEKYLNESSILKNMNPIYVKYSIYDLLRYFLIFNQFNSANFKKYLNQNYKIQLSDTKNLFNFFSNINQPTEPSRLTLFYSLMIENKNISLDHKIELGCLALLHGADPNLIPEYSNITAQKLGLNACDIFKISFGSDYNKIIEKFRKFSNLFNQNWNDTAQNIKNKLIEQQSTIEHLRHELNRSSFDELDMQRKFRINKLSTSPLTQSRLPSSQTISGLNLASSSSFPQNKFSSSILTHVPSYLNLQTARRPNELNLTQLEFPTVNINQYNTQQQPWRGGSKIKLRTFHFLEPKSYNEHAFRAEKPIIAGKMAYDFLRTHYKLKKSSSIMFTIEDRQKDRKYNYIGHKVNNKIIIKST